MEAKGNHVGIPRSQWHHLALSIMSRWTLLQSLEKTTPMLIVQTGVQQGKKRKMHLRKSREGL